MAYTRPEWENFSQNFTPVKEAQVESLFEKLKSSYSLKQVREESIAKCEVQAEECDACIDEIFITLYGQPSRPISAEEQMEIFKKESVRRKRAERMNIESTDDGNLFQESGKTSRQTGNTASENRTSAAEGKNTESGMVLPVEALIQADTVVLEHAEIDWSDLFEDFQNLSDNEELDVDWSDNEETSSNWFGDYFSCVIL